MHTMHTQDITSTPCYIIMLELHIRKTPFAECKRESHGYSYCGVKLVCGSMKMYTKKKKKNI